MNKRRIILGAVALCGLALVGAALYLDLSRQVTTEPPEQEQAQDHGPEPEASAAQKPEEPREPEGLFSQYEKEARRVLGEMSTEEKIGQVFFVRCPTAAELPAVQAMHPGGFVLFGRDFKDQSAQQVKERLAAYQAASSIPLLLGVDEEGGTVCRVSGNPGLRPQRYPSPQALYESGGLDAVRADAGEKARLLLSLGINVNLAPVADVSQDPQDFIYDRSFGQGAVETGQYVAAVVAAAQEAGIGTTMKHFPGYGNNLDTHTGSAHDTRSLQQFQQNDLVPFRAGIDAGGQSILVSHNVVDCMEPGVPASLSAKVHQLLRRDLGFEGVIMTDDLAMGAVTDYCGGTPPAVQALNAGNDLLLVTDLQGNYQALQAALEDGAVSQERLEDAVLRVLEWKLALGLFYEK